MALFLGFSTYIISKVSIDIHDDPEICQVVAPANNLVLTLVLEAAAVSGPFITDHIPKNALAIWGIEKRIKIDFLSRKKEYIFRLFVERNSKLLRINRFCDWKTAQNVKKEMSLVNMWTQNVWKPKAWVIGGLLIAIEKFSVRDRKNNDLFSDRHL